MGREERMRMGKQGAYFQFLVWSKISYADFPLRKNKTEADAALFVQRQQKVQQQTRESRPLRRWKEGEKKEDNDVLCCGQGSSNKDCRSGVLAAD